MMIRVTFQDTEYVLTEGNFHDSPIATAEDYQHGYPSFAHLYPDGRIMRFLEQIGRVEDLTFIENIPDLEPGADAFENVFSALEEGGWIPPRQVPPGTKTH